MNNFELKNIANALKVSTYEREKLEVHQSLSQLADQNLACVIKNVVNYSWVDNFWDGMEKWLSIRTQKYDKRKKYTEEVCYESFVNHLKGLFQVDVLEIIKASRCESRWIEFTTDSDYIFSMTIPNVKMIIPELTSYDNLRSISYGKISLGYRTDIYGTKYVGASYNESELKPIMDEILTSNEYKNHLSKENNT